MWRTSEEKQEEAEGQEGESQEPGEKVREQQEWPGNSFEVC